MTDFAGLRLPATGTAKRVPLSAKAWDRLYADGHFAGQWHYDHPSPELVGFLALAGLAAGARVLDAGCGAGSDSLYLARCGYRVLGIDLSMRALTLAARRAREVRVTVAFRVADVLALPLASSSLDLVTDRGCFHHIDPARSPLYAREMARVLRPGGYLLLRGFAGEDEVLQSVDAPALDAAFADQILERGPLLPVTLPTNRGGIPGNLVVLRKPG